MDPQDKQESFEYSRFEDANHRTQAEAAEACESGNDGSLHQPRVFCVGFAVFRI